MPILAAVLALTLLGLTTGFRQEKPVSLEDTAAVISTDAGHIEGELPVATESPTPKKDSSDLSKF